MLARGLGFLGGIFTAALLGRKGSNVGLYVHVDVPQVARGWEIVSVMKDGGGSVLALISLQEGVLVVGSVKECAQGILKVYWLWPQTCRVQVNLHMLSTWYS